MTTTDVSNTARPSEFEGKQWLAAHGFNVPRGVLLTAETISDSANADLALGDLRPPLAVKLMSSAVVHKARDGFLALGVPSSAAAVQTAATFMHRANRQGLPSDGVLVEEQRPAGYELFLSVYRDPQFGAVLLLGAGGNYAEAIDDVAARLCPVTPQDVVAMLDSLRAGPFLRRRQIDVQGVVDAASGLAGPEGLFALDEELEQVELNPITIAGPETYIADVVLRRRARELGSAQSPPTVPAQLERMFQPKAVAVFGASPTRITAGNRYLQSITNMGRTAGLYAVHPTATDIGGVPAFPDIDAVPEPVDLAIVAVPAEKVTEVIKAVATKARFVHVLTAGFAETDEPGRQREMELVRAAAAGDVRVLGPNCMGVHSRSGGLSFIPDAPTRPGGISLVSQSGGIAVDVLRVGDASGLGFARVVSLGNAADISAADVLDFLLTDEQTKVIGLYLEDSRDGRRIFEGLSRRPRTKPVVLLKAGTSEVSRAAAAAHTGSFSGDSRVWSGLAAQAGLSRVNTLQDFIFALGYLEAYPFERADHRTAATLFFGGGGGAGVVAADTFSALGCPMPALPAAAADRLREEGDMPVRSSMSNPFDIGSSLLAPRAEEGVLRKIVGSIVECSEYSDIVIQLDMGQILSYGPIGQRACVALADDAVRLRAAYPQTRFVLVPFGLPRTAAERDSYASVRAIAAAGEVPVADTADQAAAAVRAAQVAAAFAATSATSAP